MKQGLFAQIAACAFLSVLLAGCDVRTLEGANGEIPYAPMKNGYTDGGGYLGCLLVAGCPARGVISSSGGWGSGSSLVFNADADTLTSVSYGRSWFARSDAPVPAPITRSAKLALIERNELVRLANLGWAPRRPPPLPPRVTDMFSEVVLLDGEYVKQLDGFGAASKLGALLSKIAQSHHL